MAMDYAKRIDAVRFRVRERWAEMTDLMVILSAAYASESQADAMLRLFDNDVPQRDGAATIFIDLAMTCLAIFADERLNEIAEEEAKSRAESN